MSHRRPKVCMKEWLPHQRKRTKCHEAGGHENGDYRHIRQQQTYQGYRMLHKQTAHAVGQMPSSKEIGCSCKRTLDSYTSHREQRINVRFADYGSPDDLLIDN